LSRQTYVGGIGALLMCAVLTACQSPTRGANLDSSDCRARHEKTASACAAEEIRALQAAPRATSGGGISRGGPVRKPDGSFEPNVLSETYKDIPAILCLVGGEEDLEKFEILLILLRDIDFSVHHAAAHVMESKYGFKATRPALTVEERLALNDAATTWWQDNRHKLHWDTKQQKFTLVR